MTIIKTDSPDLHVTGERGWINDPNGLIYFEGRYHAFYQHYPDDTRWGPLSLNPTIEWLTPPFYASKTGSFRYLI